jgi:superfamily II DNA or RNA helicase
MSQESAPRLVPGDRVRVRGNAWRVERLVAYDDCARIDLSGLGVRNRGRPRSLLWPFDRPVRWTPRTRPRFVSRARWVHGLRALLLSAVDHGALSVPLTADLDLLPHQLVPALAVVRGHATRVLLADEVGLGKTVQAGLVCAELRRRGRGDRILVLTPAGLRTQWVGELHRRFALDAQLVDTATLGRRVALLPQGINPWSPPGIAVVSIDFAKHPEVLGPLAEVRWDVLVIDEAHGASPGSDRATAAKRLAESARIVLCATATPHSGDDAAFADLCSIGRLAAEPPVLLIRRSRRDVGFEVRRRTSVILVRPTSAEERMHHVLQDYIRSVWREAVRRNDRGARLAMTVLWKRALSSAASLHSSVERRLALLARDPREPWQTTLPLVDDGDPDLDCADAVSPRILAAPGLADGRDERTALARLAEVALAATAAESKLRRLTCLLSRLHEPVIVFTEFRDTLERLSAALGELGPLEMIHGGVPAAARETSCQRFSSGRARVLLATDAAGEGLNLQQACRLVVNVELPWNPMRLEQRAGRIDRIGQERRPHVVHLVARGTAEAVVQARLHLRIRRAASAIGSVRDPLGPCDDELAGHLLHIVAPRVRAGGGVRATTRTPQASSLPADLPGAAAAEAARHREARRLLPVENQRARSGPAALDDWLARELARLEAHAPLARSLGRGRGLPRGLLAVFRIRVADACGWPVEDRLLPLHAQVAAQPGRPGRLRGRPDAFDDRVRDLLARWAARAADDRAASIAPAVGNALRAISGRDFALDVHRDERWCLAQPGLFDVIRAPPAIRASADAARAVGAHGLTANATLFLVACIR